MKRLLACACLLVPLGAGAQKLDLKLGAWEMTHKSASFRKPVVEKACLTKADLAQLASGGEQDDEDCKFVKPPAVKGKTWSAEKACPGGRKVHAEFTAESPERVKGTVRSSAAKGGQAISVEISGRWLGASCKAIR